MLKEARDERLRHTTSVPRAGQIVWPARHRRGRGAVAADSRLGTAAPGTPMGSGFAIPSNRVSYITHKTPHNIGSLVVVPVLSQHHGHSFVTP